VIGHRGSLYSSLENTRRSFLTAAREGCDGVELDVFLLKCGTLVVFHGADGLGNERPGGLKHYCNIDGSILDYTADEARQLLKFNPHFTEFGCGPDYILAHENDNYITTLEEVLLDAKETGITVKIELKGSDIADAVVSLVERLELVDQCHYSSFDHSQIKRIREIRPDRLPDGSFKYKTGALFDEVPSNFVELAMGIGASEVHLKYSTCTTDRVRAIHEAGMDSMAWMRGPMGMLDDVTKRFHDVGNEDKTMYQIIMATGVKSMCVNKPAVLAALISKETETSQVPSLASAVSM